MFPSSSNVLWFLSGAVIAFLYASSSVETDNKVETVVASRHASTQTEAVLSNYVVVEYV